MEYGGPFQRTSCILHFELTKKVTTLDLLNSRESVYSYLSPQRDAELSIRTTPYFSQKMTLQHITGDKA